MPAPLEVLQEFHRSLVSTVSQFEETLIPVLRGSLPMKWWFGDRARPVADIDLECFEGSSTLPAEELEEIAEYRDISTGHGTYREFDSLVDFGKAMCRYAAEGTSYLERKAGETAIVFYDVEPPEPNNSLWVYGTPGERYYSGWRIDGNALTHIADRQGQLQIDVAESGTYKLEDIGTETISIQRNDGPRVDALTYSRGMMLAAKLSWLLRSIRFNQEGRFEAWDGEPKDIFDARLLICEGNINPQDFQHSLVAVGMEDDLDWSHLDHFIATIGDSNDDAYGNWNGFASSLPEPVTLGPAESMQMIAERLPRLLGDFSLGESEPFITAIHRDPEDVQAYVVYADWLEEHGDARSKFLRKYAARMDGQSTGVDQELITLRAETSQPWLHRLCGQGSKYAALRGRIETGN